MKLVIVKIMVVSFVLVQFFILNYCAKWVVFYTFLIFRYGLKPVLNGEISLVYSRPYNFFVSNGDAVDAITAKVLVFSHMLSWVILFFVFIWIEYKIIKYFNPAFALSKVPFLIDQSANERSGDRQPFDETP
jgi:hypothetical protein